MIFFLICYFFFTLVGIGTFLAALRAESHLLGVYFGVCAGMNVTLAAQVMVYLWELHKRDRAATSLKC